MLSAGRSALRRSIRYATELGRGSATLPRAGLIMAAVKSLTDKVGKHDGGVFSLQYLQGPVTLGHASLSATCTGSHLGTAQWTKSAGQLALGAGTMWTWSITFDDAVTSTYEFGTALTATTGICFDTSGNGRHLLFTVADTAMTCAESLTVGEGSYWLNQKGWTESDGITYYLDSSGFYLIPADVIIPALADGSGCCAYMEVV